MQQPRLPAMFRWIGSYVLITATSALAVQTRGRNDPHPIEGVLQLLDGLSNKVIFEGEQEAKLYAKFEHWCSTSTGHLTKVIEAEKEEVDALESKIEEKTKQEEQLSSKIATLTSEITSMEAAGKKALEERDAGRRLFAHAKADLTATLEAIDAALASLLEAQAATSNLQVQQASARVRAALALAGSDMPPQSRQLITTFLQASNVTFFNSSDPRPDILASGDYADHVEKYGFKSNSVIELLKQLRDKFHQERVTATQEETNAENDYHLSKLARDNAIEAATESKAEKTFILGSVQGELSAAKAEHENIMQDLKADTTTFDETSKSCEIKKAEWDERSKVRELELEAMKAAKEILSKVTGVRTEAPENPVPPPSPLSLLQFARDEPDNNVHRAAVLLRKQATALGSASLERLAVALDSSERTQGGPLDAVIPMVQKLIFKLMAEQTDEDNHKHWCDLELNKTLTAQSHKTDKLDEIAAELTDIQAKIGKASADIVLGTEMINKIDAHVEEATEIRNTGKSENAEVIKDAEEAQTAISQAIAVLKDFYEKSGMLPKSSLMQEPATLPEEPSTWDASYTGVMDPTSGGHGVLAVLTRVSEDFARMEADTRAQEAADAKEYAEEMSDLQIEKARRVKEVELKGQLKQRLASKAKEAEETKAMLSKELASVEKYLQDLQPACVAGDSTYVERKAARDAEIVALKEVQTLLSNPESAIAAAPAPSSFLQRRHQLAH